MNVVCIGSQSALKGRHRKRIQLSGGKGGNPTEQIVSQLLCGIPCHPRRHPIGKNIAEQRHKTAHNHDPAIAENHGFVSRWNNIVNDEGEEHRDKQIHDGSNKFDGKPHRHLSQKWSYIGKNVFDIIHRPIIF